MSRLRVVTCKEMEEFLRAHGFEKVSHKGSHITYRHPDSRMATVPDHGNEQIDRSLVHAILKNINISFDEFEKYFLDN